jgi:ferrochelatase
MNTTRTAILLVNLGTPQAPEPSAVRRYLAEFLSDRRVVNLPRLPWLLLLHTVILPLRARRSAAKYAAIWMTEGSPLAVYTERQAKLLKGFLGEQGHRGLTVAWAMRYGKPALPTVLDGLVKKGCDEVIVIPLYPQYSTTTTASIEDALADWKRNAQASIDIQMIESFYDHPGYIQALAALVQERWQREGRPQRLLMSFHGLPQRVVDEGDPYPAHCEQTAQRLASALNLAPEEWQLTYQSRFGPARWLAPSTQKTLENYARSGVSRVDVICPGFVSDCIETLEEIAIEARDAFGEAGGQCFRTLPCLNDSPQWISALADLALRRAGHKR